MQAINKDSKTFVSGFSSSFVCLGELYFYNWVPRTNRVKSGLEEANVGVKKSEVYGY